MKSHHFLGQTHIISLRFSVLWNGLHFFPPLQRPWKIPGESCPQLRQAAETFCAAITAQPSPASPVPPSTYARQNALFYNWLWHWHQLREEQQTPDANAPPDARIAPIVEELIRTPGISPVNYARLHQVCGLSRAQINRVFKQFTGQTPKAWKNAECLRIAEALLQIGELSVKEIAARLQFSDASHFSKWFRAHMNQTPTEWTQTQKQTA
jgi:AraC-like DNA-binding protein